MDEQHLIELIKQAVRDVFAEYRIRRRKERTTVANVSRTVRDSPSTTICLQRFEEFWQVWPKTRRKGKGRALTEWLKLKPSKELTEKILAAVEAQKQQSNWQKENGKYIPYPAKWIRDAYYEDDVTVDDETSEADKVLGPPRIPTPQEEKMLGKIHRGTP